MGLWKRIAGTVLSSFGIGNGSAGNKTLFAETGAATPPAIRWNDVDGIWEFSLDGTTWQEFVSKPSHRTLRQLIHFVGTNSPGESFAAGPYVSEVNYTGNNPIDETWYTSAAKTARICRWEATYAGVTRNSETWIVYKNDGVNPAAQAVDVISYSGLKETGRVRTIIVY